MRQSAAPISMTATRRRFVQAALHFSPQTLHSCPRGQTPRPRGRQTPCTLIAETSGEADHPGPPDARRRPSFAHAPEPVRGPGGPDASPPPPPSNARALRGRQAFSSTSPPVSSYVAMYDRPTHGLPGSYAPSPPSHASALRPPSFASPSVLGHMHNPSRSPGIVRSPYRSARRTDMLLRSPRVGLSDSAQQSSEGRPQNSMPEESLIAMGALNEYAAQGLPEPSDSESDTPSVGFPSEDESGEEDEMYPIASALSQLAARQTTAAKGATAHEEAGTSGAGSRQEQRRAPAHVEEAGTSGGRSGKGGGEGKQSKKQSPWWSKEQRFGIKERMDAAWVMLKATSDVSCPRCSCAFRLGTSIVILTWL